MKGEIGPVVVNAICGAGGKLLGQKQGRNGQLRAMAAQPQSWEVAEGGTAAQGSMMGIKKK